MIASVYVLAHPDDEANCAGAIADETARGERVEIVFLTDGTANVSAAVRAAESAAVLHDLGVPEDRITALGMRLGIASEQLLARLEDAYGALRDYFDRLQLDPRSTRITTTAWEGGHPDHDAAHLAVQRLARERGITDVREAAMYNAYRRPRGFFRAGGFASPPHARAGSRRTLAQLLRFGTVCWRYPSQRRTWVALFPGTFLRMLVRGDHALRAADPARSARRPHEGPLYYERRWNLTYASFRRQAACCVDGNG
jgi:LmbE family N-acetylglucosaminyl deacetylase